ncbi:amidase family protein [Breoghania sp.]|uniref:amidase family protein n=1 Tax=Breoghania sp. TaxID=2065378 RepID=UPI002611C430|nr:amidase family protein [Breoghania sp.]MDJ0930916.1 amidase family protein [Breoghania sp.]
MIGDVRGPSPEPQIEAATLGSRTIGLVSEVDSFALEPARAHAVAETTALLEGAGHRIIDIPFTRLAPLVSIGKRAFDRIIYASMAATFQDVRLNEDKIEPLTRAALNRGRAMEVGDLWITMHEGVLAAHAMWHIFDEVDILLTPMLAHKPPKLGSFPTDHDDIEAHWDRMIAFAPLASIANITGTPALSMPAGADEAGLPLSVQFIAPMGADRRLLAIGATLEALRPWQHKFEIAGLPQ